MREKKQGQVIICNNMYKYYTGNNLKYTAVSD